ncbi:MAG: S1-C subfamily serine protease [Candidatus Paceibacteria bacterium]|jgi:S1-C subfamily serine protease
MISFLDNKGSIPILLSVGVLLIFGVIGSIGYIAIDQYRQDQFDVKERERLVKEIEKLKVGGDQEIENLKKQLEEIINEKPNVLVREVVKQVPSSQPDLADVVAEWTPRVANISCRFTLRDPKARDLFRKFKLSTDQQIGSGSGFLMNVTNSNGSTSAAIITNAHVLSGHNGFSTPDFCNVYMLDGTEYNIGGDSGGIQYFDIGNDSDIVFVDNIPYISRDVDVGILVVPSPTEATKASASGAFQCSEKPRIGDDIVVLGYPSIGSSQSITATEGIVSGTEGNFFVTSAKVERGNSGGAAISQNNNCYFGIPTFTVSGGLESLARILDIKTVTGQ